MSLTSLYLRRTFAKSDRKRDEGCSIGDQVTYLQNLPYGTDRDWQILDVAYPKEGTGPFPVIVSVHGGGYVYGSKEEYRFYCASLAERGFAVINFNYRLAPKTHYPSQLHDINSVMALLINQGKTYPFDLDHIFMVGYSAGAQMLSQYAAICTNPAYETLMDIHPPVFHLRAIGLNCGMYDMEQLKQSQMKLILKDYLGRKEVLPEESLHVLDYITSDYPPVYIFSAGGDFLRSECEPMAQLLKERGIPCVMKIYGDDNTGHVFHLNVRLETGILANDEETAFFRQYLH